VPEVDGQYYVAVLPYSGAIGGYNLEAKHVDLSKLDPRDSIDWGTKVELKPGNVVNVYFAKAGETFDGITSLGWNAYEIKQAMVAFDQYESIINVDFRIVTDVNQATFKLVTTQGGGPLGYFNPPGETNQGVGVFWRDGFGWDENGEGGLEQGGYGFITLIHEFGHGMGLAHPHDNGGTSLVMPGAFGPFNFLGAFDLNQGVYSTMSYNDGWQMHPDIASNGYPPGVPVSYGYQGTMMALDIAVLQSKYGANTTFANGDNVYVLPTTTGRGSYYSTIWDTGGVDSIVPQRLAVGDHRPALGHARLLLHRGGRAVLGRRRVRRLHHRRRREDRERPRRLGRRHHRRQRVGQ
jgi:serralysin